MIDEEEAAASRNPIGFLHLDLHVHLHLHLHLYLHVHCIHTLPA